ncbi:MAG: hypothetical protein ABJD07_12775 [Gemmatimonadaceae bacterium]
MRRTAGSRARGMQLAAALARALAALPALVLARALFAQAVPGRELLQFPLGTIDRAPALPGGAGDGFGNPAAIRLDSAERWRVGVSAMQTPAEQSVDARAAAFAIASGTRTTYGFAVAHASVGDLYRTTTDPQTVGNIAYNTTLSSLAGAHRFGEHATVGVAIRYRTGEIDGERSGAFGADAGVLIDRLPFADVRLAAASFLWRPTSPDLARPSLHLAADASLYNAERIGLRAGVASERTRGSYREDFLFGGLRMDFMEARGGVSRSLAFDNAAWHSRLGVIFHYDQYRAGIAREQSAGGLDPLYQFTLSATIR